MTSSCAFLTLEDRSDFCIYDHLLHEPLKKRGWVVSEIPWTRTTVEWKEFDAVIIRSTWDYQNAPDVFLLTLEKIERVTRLYNPVGVCRWNLSKRYLIDLQEKGIGIVPTHWLAQLDEKSIDMIFTQTSVSRLVAKPLIGANADDTYVLDANDTQTWVDALRVFADREVMVQPFIDSIIREGEYSLFYFGGELSHSILKVPAHDDFRVQEEHGGIIRSITPDSDMIHAGNRALKAIENTLLYARVDLVRLDSGNAVVIEVELIEPSLYFEQCPESTELFADQFVRMVGL